MNFIIKERKKIPNESCFAENIFCILEFGFISKIPEENKMEVDIFIHFNNKGLLAKYLWEVFCQKFAP